MTTNLSQLTAESLEARTEDLVRRVVARMEADRSAWTDVTLPSGACMAERDTFAHFRFLIETIRACKPSLYCDYLGWAEILVTGYATSRSELQRRLRIIGDVIAADLPHAQSAIVCAFIDAAICAIRKMPAQPPTFLRAEDPLADLCSDFLSALLRDDRHSATDMLLSSADSGVNLRDLYVFVLLRSQHELERLRRLSRVSQSQQAYCADMTQTVMALLYSRFFRAVATGPTLVAACPRDELHELGMRLVADFFEMAGWDTHYLGASASGDEVLEALNKKKAKVLALSATNLQSVERAKSLIDKAHSRSTAAVLVGGQAFNGSPDLWRRIGADAYGWNADHAIRVATALTRRGKTRGLSQAS